jgi:hypothetical protein
MQQKMLCIILTCLVFNTGLIISAVVHSEAPPKVDEQTGSYIESPGASQHRQTSVNYQFEQHGSQHAKDSMNQRNNPMSQYAKDSMNKRNNPGGKYYESVKPGNPASNVTGPQRTFVTIPIIEW